MQIVIERMAWNSFLLKGWAVTLISVLYVFANLAEYVEKYYLAVLLYCCGY
jgi:hypothetical protein